MKISHPSQWNLSEGGRGVDNPHIFLFTFASGFNTALFTIPPSFKITLK
jgi:hypothetical protein